VGDYFRVAVAIKACETDLGYQAVGLSDYSGMTPISTSSCQLVVAIAVVASHQGFAVPSCSAASERSLSVAGCTEPVSERHTALSPDNVDNILFLHKIGLILQIPINRPKVLLLLAYRTMTILTMSVLDCCRLIIDWHYLCKMLFF